MAAGEALAALRAGNGRFAASLEQGPRVLQHGGELKLLDQQSPFAVVLGCSDSRVPVELVFDQSIGDLFVIRVAGNIATASQIGSVEFAVLAFGSPLVVVLGHSGCGAVAAALDAMRGEGAAPPPALASIVERVRQPVEALHRQRRPASPAAIAGEAVRANVRAAMADLVAGSTALAQRERDGQLEIVGAEYALETGVVDFFAGSAAQR